MRNSTIIVKKRLLKCGHTDYAFSKGRCKSCATQQSSQKRWEEYENGEQEESYKNLRDDADAVMSMYIRKKYQDKDGLIPCYICGKKFEYGQMHNGHYISRSHMGTRFLDKNCRPNCPTCNSNHETDITPFKNKLEQEEKGITEYLEQLGREVYHPSISDLKSIIQEYRFKLKLLKK